MEYFNQNTAAYRKALADNHIARYLLKIELLTYHEHTIGEITKDLTLDVQGQITINYKQLTRRSCSLTVANVDQKYIPSPNNTIWYQRKFKLWIGIMDDHNDVYWWSQGVYFVSSATANAHTITIEGVDKGGALDGTLKTNLAEVQYIVKEGSVIADIIRDTLALNMGSNTEMSNSVAYGGASIPIDPVQPLIDLRYNSERINADLSIDSNNYIGNLLIALADGYGADLYYDTDGRLRLTTLADVFLVDGYRYMARSWDFNNLSSPNYQYSFDGCNAVTVYTDVSVDTLALANAQRESREGISSSTGVSSGSDLRMTVEDLVEIRENMLAQNVSYTAYNVNPLSPIRVGAVGLRRMESQEIDYIDTSQSDMMSRCEQYAVMLLHKQTMLGANLTFNCPIIPHLDVNTTIGITDKYQNINNETFVIQTISLPLGSGQMNITATNIDWLPSDTNLQGMGVG